MITALPTWVRYTAPLVLGLLIGWTANGWRLGAEADQLALGAEHERAEAFRWVIAEQQRSTARMAEADKKATEELNHAEQEAGRFRDCIDRGIGCGLRVKVIRTAAQCGNVPETSSTAVMGDRGGEWVELDPGSRQDHHALRFGIQRLETALRLCVDATQQTQ